MRRRILWASLGAISLTAGCLQPLDGNLATSGGGSPNTGPAPSTLELNEAGLPIVFNGADLSTQCAPNSALCYELCGSPSCANADNTIPPEQASPLVLLPDGGASTDPCVQISAEALAIRTRSCAQCHGAAAAPPQSGISYILDDQTLMTSKSAGNLPMLVPGDPAHSYIYAKMSQGIAGDQTGMPPINASGLCPPDLAKTIVSPTAQDMSVMYAWILNCVGSDGGNGYSSTYSYGPGYAPTVGAEGGGSEAGAGGVDSGKDGSAIADSGAMARDSGAAKDSGIPEASAIDDDGGKDSSVADASSHANLITNGNFTQGTANWGIVQGTGTLTITNGQLCVAVNANQQVTLGWPQPTGSPGVPILAANSYTFTYGVRTTTRTGVTIATKVSDTVGPSYLPVDFQSLTDPATNTLATITHPFTLNAVGDTSGGLAFTFTSTIAQSVCFANVSLTQN